MVAKPGFWYRKSFFAANGLKVPATWDEFTNLLRAIAKVKGVKRPIVSGDGTGWPLSDVTEHFIAAFGGAAMHRDLVSGKVKWTDPAVKAVFDTYLVALLKAGAFSDPIEWTQAVELWWAGDYGLYFMGNWITGMVKDSLDLGVFPLPGTKALVTGPDTAFIPAMGDNKVLAKKLLSFMLSKEGQSLRAQSGGKLVIRKDVPATLYPKADQAVAEVVSKMETTLSDMDDAIGGDWQRSVLGPAEAPVGPAGLPERRAGQAPGEHAQIAPTGARRAPGGPGSTRGIDQRGGEACRAFGVRRRPGSRSCSPPCC